MKPSLAQPFLSSLHIEDETQCPEPDPFEDPPVFKCIDLDPPHPVVDSAEPALESDAALLPPWHDASAPPRLPPAPFFLLRNHFRSRLSARATVCNIGSVLDQNPLVTAVKFVDRRCKFKCTAHRQAALVAFTVFTYDDPDGPAVEFRRDEGCRALWSDLYSDLHNALYALKTAPSSVSARRCTLYTPLPLAPYPLVEC